MFLIFCACLFAQLTMQPILLSSLYGYPTLTIGLIMAPRGIASGVAMACTPLLTKYINPKYVISAGIIMSAWGSYLMGKFTLDASMASMITPTVIQGIGMGLFMVPISAFALARLPSTEITEGSGLFSYARMLGTSIGVSLLSTFISRNTQKNWNILGGNATPYSTNLKNWFLQMHLNSHTATGIARLSNLVHQQANFIAYMNGFYITAIFMLAMLPIAWIMHDVDLNNAPMAH